MFNKKKQVAAVLIPVLLTILAALWNAILSKMSNPKPFLPYLYVGTVALLAGIAAYYTQVRPVRDLEKPVLLFLSLLAEAPLKQGKKNGIKARMNLMLVERSWTKWGKRRIRVVWGSRMESHPDVKFSCNYDQGVAGVALKTQRAVMDDCQTTDKSRFGFSPKQLAQTSHVTAVWSWPVYETDKKGLQSGKVIAVVNFDCISSGAFTALSANSAAYEKHLEKFCEVASIII